MRFQLGRLHRGEYVLPVQLRLCFSLEYVNAARFLKKMAIAFLTGIFKVPNLVNRRTPPVIASASTSRSTSAVAGKGLNVLITGSSKGVGRELAEGFLKQHDSVIVTSRDEANVQEAIISIRRRVPSARVFGHVADVRRYSDVERLVTFAIETFGTVNCIICNAGTVGKRGALRTISAEEVQSVIETNLLGPLYCAKEAFRIADQQVRPLHVFIMDGSGTRGNSTPDYTAYGASKRSVPQLVSSLNAEAKGTNLRFHTLSPGMVLTDLLLAGNPTPRVRRVFNFLADEPETVSEDLVPRIRSAIMSDKPTSYIAFLTIPKALYRLATGFLLGFRKNKFFDETNGQRIDTSGRYNENGVRLKD